MSNANHKSFEVGEIVEWTSSSAGTTKTKRGVVEKILAAGASPTFKGAGRARDHVSYIVRVHTGMTSRAYWPRVSKLRLVEE